MKVLVLILIFAFALLLFSGAFKKENGDSEENGEEKSVFFDGGREETAEYVDFLNMMEEEREN